MVRAVSDEPEFPQGPALRADGTLEGRVVPETSAPAPVEERPLELVARPPPRGYSAPTAYRLEPHPRRWLPVVLVGFVVAGFGIAAAAIVFTPATPPRVPQVELPAAVRDVLPAALSGPPVVIDSEPSGATIRAASAVLGVTPWAGNNPFLTDTELTLTLPGHQPKKLVLPGAKEAHLSVTLERSAR